VKMTKVVLFDIDGVVIKKAKVFSIRLSESRGVGIGEVLKFFKGEFQECLVGKKDLKLVLPKYLKLWGIKDNLESILDFWFSGEAEINYEVLEKVRELRLGGIKCYLATNNEQYRVEYLMNNLNLSTEFDGVFASFKLGCKKPDPEFYREIMKKIGIENPREIEFWDDDEENVEGAKRFGFVVKLVH